VEQSPVSVKIVPLACPRCGAPLTIGRKDTQVKCTYCGLSCAVQRERPPDDPRQRRADTVYAPGSTLLPVTIGLGVLGLVLGWGAAAYRGHVRAEAARQSSASSDEAATERLLFFDQPMLADVNHDGHPDVVGRCHLLGDTEQTVVAAFDGKTGARLWTTPSLTKEQRSSGGRRFILEDKLLVLDDVGVVQAFGLDSGKPAWTGQLSDRPRTVCTNPGQLVVKAEDTSVSGFAVDTGKRVALESGTQCRHLVSNDTPTLDYRVVDTGQFAELGLNVSVEGMSIAHILVPTQGQRLFPFGSRTPGTSVAMVAAVAGKDVLWKSLVPAAEPLRTAYDSTHATVTYAADRLVATYAMSDPKQGVHMAAFDAASGRRLWDVKVHEGGPATLGISSTSDTVYHAADGNVYALDLQDGRLRFRIGIPP
jgi:outer membrane protein assembly factor BamB